MPSNDDELNSNILVQEAQFYVRRSDIQSQLNTVEMDTITSDNTNDISTSDVNVATETDGNNQVTTVEYTPTDNNIVTLEQSNPNDDNDDPNVTDQPTSPNDRQTNHSNETPDVPAQQVVTTECSKKNYFEDDYVMNHYVCLHTHFHRKHAVAAGLPATTHPSSVPYNYGAKGVIIKVWPGGNNDAPLSEDFRTTHEELSRTRIPRNKIFKVNIG